MTKTSIRKTQKDPPNVLVMRRVSIRSYPNGQKVALYKIDSLNLTVTIPYEENIVTALPSR